MDDKGFICFFFQYSSKFEYENQSLSYSPFKLSTNFRFSIFKSFIIKPFLIIQTLKNSKIVLKRPEFTNDFSFQ